MPTVHELAAKASGYFATAQRIDAAPEWITDMIRAAHNDADMLPDDWRYACILSALDCIAEADDPNDAAHEWADAEVDTYDSDRIAWLGSHRYRPSYCDEAAQEMASGPDEGISDMIAAGQYQEAREVYGLVLRFLEQRAEYATKSAS